jgi:hypothetical protein
MIGRMFAASKDVSANDHVASDFPNTTPLIKGGEARNPHMFARYCNEYRNKGLTISNNLFNLQADSTSTSPSSPIAPRQLLRQCLVKPIVQNPLFGYRCPNMFFNNSRTGPPTQQIDDEVKRQLDLFGFGAEGYASYSRSTRGHVYQYLRSIILVYYIHEPEIEKAIEVIIVYYTHEPETEAPIDQGLGKSHIGHTGL